MSHNPDCIFCKIAQKEFPPLGNGMFWEDVNYMARLSPFPNTEGFSVIIPKKHFGSDVLKMPNKDLQNFIVAAKKVAKIIEDGFDDVGRVGLIMEGTGIDHAHIKLFPMHHTPYLKDGRKHCESNNNHQKYFFEKYEGYVASYDGERIDDEKIAETLKKFS